MRWPAAFGAVLKFGLGSVETPSVRKVPPLAGAQKSLTPTRASQPADTLLYVEDDDENWDVAEYRLAKSYTMVRAANSEQACQHVRERGRGLCAILMDIELRGSELNGIELTELFRGKRLARELPAYARNLPAVTQPIIFVTAHGARYTDVQLMLFGADKVVLKPVDFGALGLAIASLQLARASRRA
ncbi:MAG: hypothetical protein JWN04_6392 [Myxococcaceae bacterium]|nr:hypothetical protein [Myxococcaceae bacterium]